MLINLDALSQLRLPLRTRQDRPRMVKRPSPTRYSGRSVWLDFMLSAELYAMLDFRLNSVSHKHPNAL